MKAAIATVAQPSSKSVSNVKIAPNTRNTPSLTTSMMSSAALSKQCWISGLHMPNAIAATNTAMKPLPSGGSVATP